MWSGECTLASLLIRQTILRSACKSPYPSYSFADDECGRVLLANIRGDKGLCPCPRCLIPKDKFDLTGQKINTANRKKQERKYPTSKITAARDSVYRLGKGVTSKAVDGLLKAASYVPVMVSPFLCDDR